MRIAVIGAGKMCGALVEGWVGAGLVKADHVTASVPVQDAPLLEPLSRLGCRTTHSNQDAVRGADTVVLGVKPAVVPRVAAELRDSGQQQLLVSVAAGVSTEKLGQQFGPGWRVARAMPNTAVRVREGATVFCLGAGTDQQDSETIQTLFSAVGLSAQVLESQIDAVTGVSGSGPAYMFLILEAMADEGVRQGLDRTTAYSLAAQTMVGAGRLLLSTGSHPAALKDEVTSPGGSTSAALRALEQGGLRGTLMAAVAAAADRCREMNK